jgi:transcription elongation GreA/GreB family factor
MRTILQRSSYEKLIGQTVYIEENTPSIQETLVRSKILNSKTDAKLYFEKYIKKVETLFENITVVDDNERQNRIPFVVLDSSFTLRDSNDRVYYCHLIYDNTWGGNRNLHQIYFLSETGMALLLKAEGNSVSVNMGNGYSEHKISSIRI